MFDGYGALELHDRPLWLSYRDEESWPTMTPGGSIKNFTFGLGDPVTGPIVQLGLVTRQSSEPLDWKHVVDPPHFHGSDQFRVLAGGRWSLAGQPLATGEFAFQEAGRVYREHPDGDDPAWILLIIGDRRGSSPTVVREEDRSTVIDTGNALDRPVDAADYAHPAGPRGLPAVATTGGSMSRGYLRGRIADVAAGALSGVLGDARSGPVVHVLHVEPHAVVPAHVAATEQFLAVISGSCSIDDAEHRGGDMRVQPAGVSMPEVVAGPDGVELTLVVADRRARRSLLPVDVLEPSWWTDGRRLEAALAG